MALFCDKHKFTVMKGKKYGGRQAGTPNKMTGRVREMIMQLFEDNWDTLQDDVVNLKPVERTRFFAALIPFVCARPVEKQEEGEGVQTSDDIVNKLLEQHKKNSSKVSNALN